jgi:hypothetical protein
MLDLVDTGVMDTRRFCDLSLGIPLVDRLTDQAISFGIKRVCAADFVSYPSEAGQRVLAGHSISSRLRCALLVAIAFSGYHRRDARRVRTCRIGVLAGETGTVRQKREIRRYTL